jgi:hypothetical protein
MMLHPDDILRLHNRRRADLAKQFRTVSWAREAARPHGGWQSLLGWGPLVPGLRRRRPASTLARS